MGWSGTDAYAAGRGPYVPWIGVGQPTFRTSPSISTVSLCNANFSRVSLGNTSHEGASHA